MSLQTNITNGLNALAAAIKTNRVNVGDLSSLTTTAKASIVAAINELKSGQASAAGIDDTATSASTSKTYSANKITSLITGAINNLVNGAPAALDTLKEISDQLAADESAAASLTTAVGNRVRFDAAQSLTGPQQAQAQANIAVYSTSQVGDVAHDFVADVTAALA